MMPPLTRDERVAVTNRWCEREADAIRQMFNGARYEHKLPDELAALERRRLASIALIDADYAPVQFVARHPSGFYQDAA